MTVRQYINGVKAKITGEKQESNAKWIPVKNGRGGNECSNCHEYAPSFMDGSEHLTNYCPNCGKKMEKDKDIYKAVRI